VGLGVLIKNPIMTTQQLPRVLVVEDLTEMRSLLRSLLESMGFAVDESTNAEDGIAMLMGDPEIGVVLLDLGLPPFPNGFSEGVAFLKAANKRGNITKTLVLTGQVASEATRMAIEHGAFDVLSKPFQPDLLRAALERAVSYYRHHTQMRQNNKVAVNVVADTSDESNMQLIKDELMVMVIRAALADTNHNVSAAARKLNMTREHLYYYIKKYGIERP